MAKAIEIEAARQEILARVQPTRAESIGLGEALGRRLATDAVADGPYQPFDNSAMDGFAVRSADLAAAGEATPVKLSVVDESRAGSPAGRGLGPGEAIAISTGAMLPEGADAVVRVEDTERVDDTTPAPEATFTSGTTLTSGAMPIPEPTLTSEATPAPDTTPVPEATPAPGSKPAPEAGPAARTIPAPDTTPVPEATPTRQATPTLAPDERPAAGASLGDPVRPVLVHVSPAPEANVRRAGEDIAAGEILLRAGTELGPAELGALATIGADPVEVHRRPRVAVVTSGDELTPPGRPLAPGGIRDSNSHTVAALARLAGAKVVSVAWAPDEPGATRDVLAAALDADVAIVCGGVSVGEHDHVKEALAELGAEKVFWRVALKPGGPTWFGTRGETLVFGLPGNPVSVMATFLLLVRPALLALAGAAPDGRRTVARLGAAYEKPTDRAHAVRCRLELTPEGWVAWPLPRQGSHVLTSMLAADCLALVPTDSAGLAAGETVEVELLDRASMGR